MVESNRSALNLDLFKVIMPFPRSSGILLHPTCLPSRFGIGDLGSEAYRFIDFLAQSSQQLWQILPLGPAGHGNSPYMSYSAMAGNPMLISPEVLRDDGFLIEADFANLPIFPIDQVDFGHVIPTKTALLKQAFERFKSGASPLQQQAFIRFCETHAYWLDDYALFMALKEVHGGVSWNAWEPAIVDREPEAMAQWHQNLEDEIFFHKYLQFEFFRQWSELKQYANQHGIQIIGDIPIYVAYDSVDVWAHPENYYLDRFTAEPELVAGVPPDYFSETGQLWGNPVYKWKRMQANGYQWWVQRIKSTLEYVDIIRLDHFRGFSGFWIVEQGESDATRGTWMRGPGNSFFAVLKEKIGRLPIIAEDLGLIDSSVEELRDEFELPGMKILQFAFGDMRNEQFFPANFPHTNCVVYTGTHDNDTLLGWFSKLSQEKQDQILFGPTFLEGEGQRWMEHGIQWAFIWLAFQSIANQAIIPLQDVLGLGNEARMNVPSQADGNWNWRYARDMLTEELGELLRGMTETYNRAPVKQGSIDDAKES